MGVGCQLHALAVLPPRKNPLVPVHQRLGGPQSWSGRDKSVASAWSQTMVLY